MNNGPHTRPSPVRTQCASVMACSSALVLIPRFKVALFLQVRADNADSADNAALSFCFAKYLYTYAPIGVQRIARPAANRRIVSALSLSKASNVDSVLDSPFEMSARYLMRRAFRRSKGGLLIGGAAITATSINHLHYHIRSRTFPFRQLCERLSVAELPWYAWVVPSN